MHPLQGQALGGNIKHESFNLEATPQLYGRVLGHTNIGRGRDKNQDAASLYTMTAPTPWALLSIADGLGSYYHSERASLRAVTEIPTLLTQLGDLTSCCLELHRDLIQAYPYEAKSWKKRFKNYLKNKFSQSARSTAATDCGSTTFACCLIQKDELTIANIGDSRVYLFRKGQLHYKTRDQSLLELLVTQNKIANDPHMLATHPQRGVILNSLGAPHADFHEIKGEDIKLQKTGVPSIDQFKLEPGDLLFLATDGVFSNITDPELTHVITQTPFLKLEETLKDLLTRVLRMGWTNLGQRANPDNFTFIVYKHESL